MAALTSVVVTALVLFFYTSSWTLVVKGPLVTDIVSCKRERQIPGSLFHWTQDFRAVPNRYIYNRRMFYYQELSESLTVCKLQLNRLVSPFRVGYNWKLRAIWWTAALLLLSGGINPNPGPPRHLHLCVVCSKVVRQVGIKCDICSKWCHPKCAWMDDMEYQRLGNSADAWSCPACCLPSFNDSFF